MGNDKSRDSLYIHFFLCRSCCCLSFLHSYVLFFLRHVPDMLFGLSLFGRKQQFFSPVRVTSKRLFFLRLVSLFFSDWAWIKSHQILSILHLKVIVEIFFLASYRGWEWRTSKSHRRLRFNRYNDWLNWLTLMFSRGLNVHFSWRLKQVMKTMMMKIIIVMFLRAMLVLLD